MIGTRFGPDLRGVLGRRIASVPNYPYSPALRAAGGSWTPERLDAFLREPTRFAPGTAMATMRVEDAATRQTIIRLLAATAPPEPR